jgi:hypothetical protein
MKWLGIVGVLVVGMVVLYGVSYPGVTVRYRLTLEALVDGELKTASGVREVTYSKGLAVGGQGALSIGVRGEAIALDLGDRGTLFALLSAGLDSRSGPEWIVLRAFGFDGGSMPSPVEEGIKQVSRLSGRRELPLDSLPKLVRFRDLGDLRSVEWVNPLNIGDRFGAGAKLVRVTLEIVPTGIWPLNDYGITGEPLTSGIESKLAWWNRPWLESIGDGVFIDTKVNKEDFKRG